MVVSDDVDVVNASTTYIDTLPIENKFYDRVSLLFRNCFQGKHH